MSNLLEKKKESIIEEAFLLRDKGKRISYIADKFPGYELDIREHFGIVAFLKGIADKVTAPKNVLKIIISKIPDNSAVQTLADYKKEVPKTQEKPIPAFDEKDAVLTPENNILSKRLRIIIFLIALIALSLIYLRKNPTQNDVPGVKNIEMLKRIDVLRPVGNINDILPAVGVN